MEGEGLSDRIRFSCLYLCFNFDLSVRFKNNWHSHAWGSICRVLAFRVASTKERIGEQVLRSY